MADQEDDKTRTHIVISAGMMVNHYRIIKKIGAGGMGEVYLAEDTRLKRQVALKFLPPQLAPNKEVYSRFVREAQILAKLNHPNIVGIYDVNASEQQPFYAMELIEGKVLHHFCHEAPPPIDVVIEFAIQICQGLSEAHRAGIIHRDIKSSNIIVDNNNRVRLIDFGLAAHDQDDKLTKTGSTLGTVSYMSPEQISGRDIDHRSDLFSFGVVLYELLAGRTPFRRDNEGATLKAILEDAPEPISRYKSSVPEKLQEIVMQLLEKDKAIRYQSAEGVIADLKRLVYDSRPSQLNMPTRQQPGKNKTGLIIGAAAVVVLVVLAFVFKSNFTGGGPSTSTDDDEIPMIAVLPFENLGAANDEYFAAGMTDEITSRLASISGLGVISRTSAMKYRESNASLSTIGKELGVNYVIEGTVRWSKVKDQLRVRITPELVRVSDGRHMWGETYERELSEVFAVQADIATKIVDQLDVALIPQDRQRLDRRPTDNDEAYALYLMALSLSEDITTTYLHEDEIKAAIDSAVALDPEFALAYALRSKAYSWAAFGIPHSAEARIARESAEKSLELVPGLAQGHIALGNFYNLVETDYDRALEEFTMARSESHNDPDLMQSIGLVQLRQGKFEAAVSNLRKSAELDPLNSGRHRILALALSTVRDYTQAENACDRAISLSPDEPAAWQGKMEVIANKTGDWDQVLAVARKALEKCDSVEFLSNSFNLIDHYPEIDWPDIMNRYRENFKSRPPIEYIGTMALMNYSLNDREQFEIYVDSLRKLVEKEVTDNPDDYESISFLGLIYSETGHCDKAIEYGRLGVDSLSVEKCHW